MCGIAGICYVCHGNVNLKDLESMTNILQHRGPDDKGFLLAKMGSTRALQSRETKSLEAFSENNHPDLGMGHRRLSIIDLSDAGHQPMCNEDESVWIVYNGEIYNYIEIRKELESRGHYFKSQTDTEIILHSYEEWEIDCLRRFNGMWAFAIYDLRKKRIFCSRDRAGVKPFYYMYDGARFCFASEIKALLKINNFSIEPNEQIIADYLFSGLLDHGNETFFKRIYQLRPGEYLLFEGNRLIIRSYWDVEGKEVRFARDRDYAERFYEFLEDSIRLRLRSDVPIGSCLSGGLDSSSIVCLANRLMFHGQNIDPELVGERQKTFSSCFEELAYDERKFIELVTHQTGAEKNYVFPKAENLFRDLPMLIWHQDEPFGSTSIYAQWRVMGLTKERGVIVLLDGQGGDELLAGYPPSFYFLFSQALKRAQIWHLIKEVNQFRRNHLHFPNQFALKIVAVMLPSWIKPLFHKWLRGRIEWAEEGFRKKCFRIFPKPVKLDNDLDNYLYQIFRYTTLPGLLHYEDRNSMAFSIETRLPFLDYRLVEYLFSLPYDQKIAGGISKVVLRNAMKDILPEEVRNRKDKMGFVTPEDVWFRTILRNQILEIISSKSFAERGYFNVNQVKKAFHEHCKGIINISSTIWRWVNLELWLRAFIDRRELIGYEGHGNEV
jgi:asparagine synthase (glutamine-hydrolysing)